MTLLDYILTMQSYIFLVDKYFTVLVAQFTCWETGPGETNLYAAAWFWAENFDLAQEEEEFKD